MSIPEIDGGGASPLPRKPRSKGRPDKGADTGSAPERRPS